MCDSCRSLEERKSIVGEKSVESEDSNGRLRPVISATFRMSNLKSKSFHKSKTSYPATPLLAPRVVQNTGRTLVSLLPRLGVPRSHCGLIYTTVKVARGHDVLFTSCSVGINVNLLLIIQAII